MLAKPGRNSKGLAMSLVGLGDDLGCRMCTMPGDALQSLATPIPLQIGAKIVAQASAKGTKSVGQIWVELGFKWHDWARFCALLMRGEQEPRGWCCSNT